MHMEKRRKTWSSIRYGSMRIPERSRKQLRNRTTDGLFGIMPCRKPIRSLTSGTWRHFGLAFSSCMKSCPSTPNWYGAEMKRILLVRYAKADRPQSTPGALAKSPSHRDNTHCDMIESFRELPLL